MTAASPAGPIAAPPSGPPSPPAVGAMPAVPLDGHAGSVTSRGSSTPRRMRVRQLLVVLACLLLGLVLVVGSIDRRSKVDRAERASDLVVAAQELRAALGRADAASVNAYLAGGVDQPDQRARYTAAIADAAGRLQDAARVADSIQAAASATRLQELLPVYNGRIETARANARQELPLGGAYLRNASALLRSSQWTGGDDATGSGTARPGEIGFELDRLEAAGDRSFRDVDGDLVGGLGVVLLVVIALVVVVFVWVQRWLSGRTRRTLNAGMAAASALLLIVVLWVASSVHSSATRAATATRDGYDTLSALSALRADAYDHQASATFALVDRGAAAELNAQAATAGQNVQARLGAERAGALEGPWERYVQASMEATVLAADGNHDEAATEFKRSFDDPSSIAGRFEAFDQAVIQLVGDADAELRDGLNRARRPSDWVLVAGIAMVLVAAVGAWGIQQRINDYR